RNMLHSVLHKLDRLVVLQAEEARWAHEIALAQTMASHLVVVALEAEHRPLHNELVRTSRYNLAHAKRIHLALDDQIWPDGCHRHRPGTVELLDEVHEARLRQRHAVAIGAHLLLGIAGYALAFRLGRRHDPVPPGRVRKHERSVARDQQPERHQESVQQGGVIRVLEILVVELPIAGQRVAVVAQKPRLSPRATRLEPLEHLRAEVILPRLHVSDIGSEHDAAVSRDIEPTQSMPRAVEIGGHAALSVDPASERNAGEIALKIVGPLMVRADEFFGVAAELATEFCGAM